MERRGLAWLLCGFSRRSAPFGIDPARFIRTVRGMGWFVRDYCELRRQAKRVRDGAFPFGQLWPCVDERDGSAGNAYSPYFWQDFLVARRVMEASPTRHVDIGSRIDGFVAYVACFRKIEVFDVRPLPVSIPNVVFRQCDMMAVPPGFEGYCDSLSSLCALEHFGLGRYGDPIDYYGHVKGLYAMQRILRPGGLLYLSVPVGEQRIEFNAHRVFSLDYLMGLFAEGFAVERFTLVDDRGICHEGRSVTAAPIVQGNGCGSKFGIFELRRLPST